tara:strand:+ start:277 stop:1233 length:957 start_codon:yes stop_codon:yes gene_type:complete
MVSDSCDSTSSTRLLKDFKYNDDLSYEDNLTIYRSLLNEYEQKKFDVNRQYNYWLTFTICVIYGSIAIIILLSCYFFTWANEMFLNKLYYFTITFIIGTIIIIIILTYQVFNFNFPNIEQIHGYEINYCPDYWNYEHKKFSDNIRLKNSGNTYTSDEKKHLEINCNFKNEQHDILQTSRIFDSYQDNNPYSQDTTRHGTHGDSLYVSLPQTQDSTTNKILNPTEYKKFREYVSHMNGIKYNSETDTIVTQNFEQQPNYATEQSGDTSDIKIDCNNVYPRYLAEKDIKYAEEQKTLEDNKFRCAYSEVCKMPWSEAGCS